MAAPVRRLGLPEEFIGVKPDVYLDPGTEIPLLWLPRGRWRGGPIAMHTFTDDYRQEFFWRRPVEGAIVAVSSGICTAPDFSVYPDDPMQWAQHQAWRSAVIATYWQELGCRVLPVVSFGSGIERYVRRGSMWAVRGPARGGDEALYRAGIEAWARKARPGGLVVFGRALPDGLNVRCAVVRRPLVSSKGLAAHVEGGGHGRP